MDQMRKTHVKMGRRSWDTILSQTSLYSDHLPTPHIMTHNQEEIHNSIASPWGVKGLKPTLASQLLGTTSERWAPKTSSFECQQDPQDPQGYSKLRKFLKCPCKLTWPHPRDQPRGSHLQSAQSFCDRGLFVYLKAEGQASNLTQI